VRHVVNEICAVRVPVFSRVP